jgi:hypothetical protein
MPRRSADRIRAVLRRHGLSEQAARAAVNVGDLIHAQTEEHGVEFAALLDADSGRRVGRILGGRGDQVDASPHLRAMRPGREYLALHTHPDSTAFSQADAALLLLFPRIRALSLVGADGTWYALSVAPNLARPNPVDLAFAMRQRYLALRPSYEARSRTGELTQAAARRELSHELWTDVARQFGLRYHRVEP